MNVSFKFEAQTNIKHHAPEARQYVVSIIHDKVCPEFEIVVDCGLEL